MLAWISSNCPLINYVDFSVFVISNLEGNCEINI